MIYLEDRPLLLPTTARISDPPEYLVEPFITRKEDGMGLGLHLASEVMKNSQKGRLVFPDAGILIYAHPITGPL